jgi:hypothetical protein
MHEAVVQRSFNLVTGAHDIFAPIAGPLFLKSRGPEGGGMINRRHKSDKKFKKPYITLIESPLRLNLYIDTIL